MNPEREGISVFRGDGEMRLRGLRPGGQKREKIHTDALNMRILAHPLMRKIKEKRGLDLVFSPAHGEATVTFGADHGGTFDCKEKRINADGA